MENKRSGRVWDFYKIRKGALRLIQRPQRDPHVKWRLKGQFSDAELEELKKYIREDFGEGYVVKQKRVLLHVYYPSAAKIREDDHTSYRSERMPEEIWEDYGSEDAFWECNGI